MDARVRRDFVLVAILFLVIGAVSQVGLVLAPNTGHSSVALMGWMTAFPTWVLTGMAVGPLLNEHYRDSFAVGFALLVATASALVWASAFCIVRHASQPIRRALVWLAIAGSALSLLPLLCWYSDAPFCSDAQLTLGTWLAEWSEDMLVGMVPERGYRLDSASLAEPRMRVQLSLGMITAAVSNAVWLATAAMGIVLAFKRLRREAI